ncbi:MAG: hypothetical protein WCH43_05680 [Verrucomicrobiota bacterium]
MKRIKPAAIFALGMIAMILAVAKPSSASGAGSSGLFVTTIANGSYDLDFSGVIPLWNISGSYTGDFGSGIGLDFTFTADPSGKITGNGTAHLGDGFGNDLNGSATATGTVKNSGTLTRVAMTVLSSGTGNVSLFGFKRKVGFQTTAKLNFEIDSANKKLVFDGGSVSTVETDLATRLKISNSFKLPPGGSLPLPADVNGDWSVAMDLTPIETRNGIKYTGTASAQDSTGGVIPLTVTGNYSTKNKNSKLTLKGGGGSLSFVALASGTEMNLRSMNGTLFGQKLNLTNLITPAFTNIYSGGFSGGTLDLGGGNGGSGASLVSVIGPVTIY